MKRYIFKRRATFIHGSSCLSIQFPATTKQCKAVNCIYAVLDLMLRYSNPTIQYMDSSNSYSWLKMVVIGGGCLGLGYVVGRYYKRKSKPTQDPSPYAYHGKADVHPIEQIAEIMDDFKMVLVVRHDLKMGKGKIAAQCSHATLGLYKKLFYRAPKSLQRWEMCSQVKVVTRVDSEEELLLLQNRAKTLKLPTHITIDAGKTQISPNSRTVLALLGPCDLVDEVTGELKLL